MVRFFEPLGPSLIFQHVVRIGVTAASLEGERRYSASVKAIRVSYLSGDKR
jgi:hypothetical protein